MNPPILKAFDLPGQLLILGNGVAILAAICFRRFPRFRGLRRDLVVGMGVSTLLYYLPTLCTLMGTERVLELLGLALYSLLECWLIWLLLSNGTLPPTRRDSFYRTCSSLLLFWILVLLGNPRFVLIDTATMMAAEAIATTALALFQLETLIEHSSVNQFMRSDDFSSLLRTLAYFSSSIPLFFLTVSLVVYEKPNGQAVQYNEMVTYVGYFLMIRKKYHVLPSY